jgi:hypothetical protein
MKRTLSSPMRRLIVILIIKELCLNTLHRSTALHGDFCMQDEVKNNSLLTLHFRLYRCKSCCVQIFTESKAIFFCLIFADISQQHVRIMKRMYGLFSLSLSRYNWG